MNHYLFDSPAIITLVGIGKMDELLERWTVDLRLSGFWCLNLRHARLHQSNWLNS